MSVEAALQLELAGFLRRRHDLTKDPEAQAFAERHLAGSVRLTPVEQLEIYREQFWLRHTSSLLEDYPGVAGLLEQERWNRLVEPYLEHEAVYGFTLRDLGARLPAFVERQEWLEQRQLVLDLARYEWAHVEVFDAPDVPPLDPAKLAAVPEHAWEFARIALDPALRLLALEHPVTQLRRGLLAAQANSERPKPPLPAPEPAFLAVHRRERAIVADVLEFPAFLLLQALAAGSPLGKACEAAAHGSASEPEALAGELQRWFGTWAARGYIVDVLSA